MTLQSLRCQEVILYLCTCDVRDYEAVLVQVLAYMLP